MSPTVAALYVSRKGPYWGRPDVDAWDEERDARLYQGDLPVVAHPPCGRWGKFAKVNFVRWGGEHNRPGNDGGCFDCALSAIRLWGGVLEHPASSAAWTKHQLARPPLHGWGRLITGEWACEVWQSAYGHLARKKTWLLYCGATPPHDLLWVKTPGQFQIGGYDRNRIGRNKPSLLGIAASLTPPAFADALLSLARNCGGSGRMAA